MLNIILLRFRWIHTRARMLRVSPKIVLQGPVLLSVYKIVHPGQCTPDLECSHTETCWSAHRRKKVHICFSSVGKSKLMGLKLSANRFKIGFKIGFKASHRAACSSDWLGHKHVLPANIIFTPLLLHSWLTQVPFQWTGTWRSHQKQPGCAESLVSNWSSRQGDSVSEGCRNACPSLRLQLSATSSENFSFFN